MVFIPSAILLGALHGLEPGHSKTMMAAFIIAIKGTVRQAVMLGVAATLSHTAVVWLIALEGCISVINLPQNQPNPATDGLFSDHPWYGFWMFWRTGAVKNWLEGMQENEHHHHDETRLIDTGHGKVELSILKKDNFPTGGYALLVAKDGLLKISH